VTQFVDSALLEMFAAEVETHMAALNDGLLVLEQNPAQSEHFEALMRAAHSIKGAAKLVGLQAAVEVAHVIEDCFVAARAGRLAMTSALVDVLLEGVDLLGRVAQYDAPQELQVSGPQVAATVQKIVQATTAAPVTAAPVTAAPVTATPVTAALASAPASEARTPQPATTPVHSHRARAAEFSPLGALDANWTIAIHREIAAGLGQGQIIEVDLGGVSEIDPLGLALLTLVARSGGEAESPLHLRNVPARFDLLLRSVGLAQSCRIAKAEH
jgi:chemotaxis protein histidine kinase CheA